MKGRIMNAKEARAKTIEAWYSLNSDMEEIFNKIREACLKKEFSASIWKELSKNEVDILIDLGYEVEDNDFSERIAIKW